MPRDGTGAELPASTKDRGPWWVVSLDGCVTGVCLVGLSRCPVSPLAIQRLPPSAGSQVHADNVMAVLQLEFGTPTVVVASQPRAEGAAAPNRYTCSRITYHPCSLCRWAAVVLSVCRLSSVVCRLSSVVCRLRSEADL